jgi:hypothetical protein
MCIREKAKQKEQKDRNIISIRHNINTVSAMESEKKEISNEKAKEEKRRVGRVKRDDTNLCIEEIEN